ILSAVHPGFGDAVEKVTGFDPGVMDRVQTRTDALLHPETRTYDSNGNLKDCPRGHRTYRCGAGSSGRTTPTVLHHVHVGRGQPPDANRRLADGHELPPGSKFDLLEAAAVKSSIQETVPARRDPGHRLRRRGRGDRGRGRRAHPDAARR